MIGKKDIIDKEIEQTEREMLSNMYMTALKKAKFVNQLKTGLGSEIKAIGGRVNIIKKSWFQKLIDRLRKIFTKF
jgi:hypothetical protein